ncbi:MAG: fluoride efflux transporter CrcB [Capsulimonadaceae bacterium]
MTPGQYALIAVGGALGALARYIVGYAISIRFPTSFPWGTFVINITGSFIIGLVSTLVAERMLVSPNWRPLVTIGFVGAYTTFSTFEYETVQLAASWRAFANLAGSVVSGYGAVLLGIRLGQWLSLARHAVAR